MKTLAREKYKQKKEWRRRKVREKNAANSPHEVLSTMPNGSTRTSLQPKFIYCGWAEHNYKMVQFKFYRHGICLPGSVVKNNLLLTVSKQVFSYSPGNDNLPDSGQGWNTETTFRVRSRHERSFSTSKSNIFDIWNFRKSEWFASPKKCLIVSSCHQNTWQV